MDAMPEPRVRREPPGTPPIVYLKGKTETLQNNHVHPTFGALRPTANAVMSAFVSGKNHPTVAGPAASPIL